jgi:S-adenosylmethionine decarboxylase
MWRRFISLFDIACAARRAIDLTFIKHSIKNVLLIFLQFSESSLFVFPHRIILKTCGTTLNLLGLPRILEIANNFASLPSVYRCFYSRKSFMFPERQLGPHREWKDEVSFLDAIFPNGAAYTVGKVNGDHWLLYMTTPGHHGANGETAPGSPGAFPLPPIPSRNEENEMNETLQNVQPDTSLTQDYTIEILMSSLSPEAREPFFLTPCGDTLSEAPSIIGRTLSSAIGISDLFPPHLTTLDAYAFTPCGYSSNALLKWMEDGHGGEGYYTIHVTPEEGWSYASFECNVPLSTSPSSSIKDIPDLQTLIRRIVDIFQPGRLSLTLFISNVDNNNTEEDEGETAVEAAQRSFKSALAAQRPASCSSTHSAASRESGQSRRIFYRRTDKINYEFGGYNLAFASFELR